VEKPKTEFVIAKRSKSGIGANCDECQRNREHDYLIEQHERIEEAKMGEFCVVCGERDPIVLEFDHPTWDCKSFTISKRRKMTGVRFFTEVSGTQFLCVCCHCDKSALERELRWRRGFNLQSRRRRHLLEYNEQRKREAGECIDCELRVPQDPNAYVMLKKFHWDHRNRDEKIMPIATMISRRETIECIGNEISKCDLRCANCHKKRTAIQMGYRKYRTRDSHPTNVRVPWDTIPGINQTHREGLALLIVDGMLERYGTDVNYEFDDKIVTARRYIDARGNVLRRVDMVARLLQRWDDVDRAISDEVYGE
jgi:hypothetical protein